MLTPDFNFEKSLLPPDCRFLMGIDEVGRGPWAGPVTVGAFILDLDTFDPQIFINLKVRDSKTLSELQRQKIYTELNSLGFVYQTFSASSFTVDQQGIGGAIEKLIQDALIHFHGQFDYCLIDGNLNTDHFNPILSKDGQGEILHSLIDADARCFSVAAAAIMAKVVRDTEMANFDLLYPEYDFKNNKGYGTKSHQLGLASHGVCPIHRRSYTPIKRLLNK